MENSNLQVRVKVKSVSEEELITDQENVFLPIKGTKKAFEVMDSDYGLDLNTVKGAFWVSGAYRTFNTPLVTRITEVHENGTVDITAFLMDNIEHLELFLIEDGSEDVLKTLQMPIGLEIPNKIKNINPGRLVEADNIPSLTIFKSEIYYL